MNNNYTFTWQWYVKGLSTRASFSEYISQTAFPSPLSVSSPPLLSLSACKMWLSYLTWSAAGNGLGKSDVSLLLNLVRYFGVDRFSLRAVSFPTRNRLPKV